MDVSMAQVGHGRAEYEWSQAAIFMCNCPVTSQALHRTTDIGALTEAFFADDAGAALGGFRKCRRLRATAPMRLGAPRFVSGDWGLGAAEI